MNNGFRRSQRKTLSSAIASIFITGLVLSSCTTNSESISPEVESSVTPSMWPKINSAVPKDEKIESRIDSLIHKMTLEEKVGQILQPEIGHISAAQVKKYHIGSVLNGGGTFPKGNKHASVGEWVKMADDFYLASTSRENGRTGIPIIWGSDAVHGHNNVYGATLLPHNIGLGAANNPALIRRLGEITAREVAATGLDWTFAPTLAVVRDDRWGRTYESYAETPEIVSSYAKEVVEGIQGVYGEGNFMDESHLLANAKHYLGDGGTFEGRDQGDNRASEQKLRDIHAPGYFAAIEAGAQIVMASFSSWKGNKLHGHKGLLTDILKNKMGFDGFVISDWNGHQQIPGCSASSCPQAINAGIDMVMVTEDWQLFYENTLSQVKDGVIPMARLNDAVRRILRVKARAGILDGVQPSKRALAGKSDILGAPEHKAAARQAVRESLVLLKNNQSILPLNPKQRILVLGDGANDIGKQSGGWTLSWQGTGNTNKDFPNGESIYEGLQHAVDTAGGEIHLHTKGEIDFSKNYDVAIMVFGEDPYAEFQGDRKSLVYTDKDQQELEQLKLLNAQEIPVVSIFLSGRPLWVNPYINQSHAFVAAWLPGSEGGGIADVIIRDQSNKIRNDFKGKLSFSWPKSAIQFNLNSDTTPYDPQFPVGYGLTYSDKVNLSMLSEKSGLGSEAIEDEGVFFSDGRTIAPWNFYLDGTVGAGVLVSGNQAKSRGGEIHAAISDRYRQGDSIEFLWTGKDLGRFSLVRPRALDLSRESNGGLAIAIQMRVENTSEGDIELGLRCSEDCVGRVPITSFVNNMPKGKWQTLRLRLSCFEDAGAEMHDVYGISIASRTQLQLAISDMRLVSASDGAAACPNPQKASS